MDILPIALVFLIMLLSIFLSVLGIQVFLILKDLRRDLNRINKFINSVEREPLEEDAKEPKQTEKPVEKKVASENARRFYKKVLK